MHKELGVDILTYIMGESKKDPTKHIVCTEVELAKRFQVSRQTIRKRIDRLVEEKQLVRISGKGLALTESAPHFVEPSGRCYLIMVSSFLQEDGFFSEISKGVIDTLNAQGDAYRIITSMDFRERLAILKATDWQAINGIIMTAYECEECYSMVELLNENAIPIVLVDNQLEKKRCNCVKNDDFGGGELIGRHLVEKGVKRVAFVLRDKQENAISPLFESLQFDSSLRERFAGLKNCLGAHGIALSLEDCFSSKEFCRQMKQQTDYDAFVFCDSKVLADVIMDVQVPSGIEICTFGENFLTHLPDTYVHTRFEGYELGCSAAKRIGQIQSDRIVVEDIAMTLLP